MDFSGMLHNTGVGGIAFINYEFLLFNELSFYAFILQIFLITDTKSIHKYYESLDIYQV